MVVKVAVVMFLTVLSTTAKDINTSPDLKSAQDSNVTTQNSTNGETGKRRQRDTETNLHLHSAIMTKLGKRHRRKKIRYLFRSENGNWEELNRSAYNAAQRWEPIAKVKVLIHGYSPSEYMKSGDVLQKMHIFDIGDAYYVASGENKYNVIVMDWTSLSTEPLYKYNEAALSTTHAGKDAAKFLRKLKRRGLIGSWEDVHLLGVSLGAHVAGVAGAAIQRQSGDGVKIGRITGIDPAGPLFDHVYSNKTHALSRDDANFVDVIHCNMGPVGTFAFHPGRFGTAVQSGHADFYPNGGESQRDCSERQNIFEFCSHAKCPLYFVQSISEYYLSCPCQSWEDFRADNCPCSRNDGVEMAMGEQCSNRARGKYYRFM